MRLIFALMATLAVIDNWIWLLLQLGLLLLRHLVVVVILHVLILDNFVVTVIR